MSPEQLINSSRTTQLTVAVDVWALGVIMYRMLTGKFPFTDVRNLILQKVLALNPEKIQNRRPSVSEEIVRVCDSCLQSEDRRSNANTVWNLLHEWEERFQRISEGRTKYTWHPDLVLALTGKRMVFLLLDLSCGPIESKAILARILSEYDCTIYRVYRVLGEYDVLVKGFMSLEKTEELVRSVERGLVETLAISRILKGMVDHREWHWYWNEGAFSKDDVDTVADVESILGDAAWDEKREGRTAIEKQYLRIINENAKRKIFTFSDDV